ncbi:MAG: uracil-DNA glycosylase [Planctomycetota bacterium]
MTTADSPEQRLARSVRQHLLTDVSFGVTFGVTNAAVPVSAASVPDDGAGPQESGLVRQVTVGSATHGGASAERLDELRARYERDAPHASFGHSFSNIVFGEGDPDARLMFVGEAPGADEDASGRPFVGRAGQLLEKMIGAMGLSRETVYIANVLKVRPDNNATPTLSEREASWPYLQEQIGIVSPEVIVTLGLPATHTVLDTSGSMAKLRARFHPYLCVTGRAVEVMPTYHPAYLLRSYTAENRQKVWSDLQQVMRRLGFE